MSETLSARSRGGVLSRCRGGRGGRGTPKAALPIE